MNTRINVSANISNVGGLGTASASNSNAKVFSITNIRNLVSQSNQISASSASKNQLSQKVCSYDPHPDVNGTAAWMARDVDVPPYIQMPYHEGLAHYKTPHMPANESLYRHWLAQVNDSDQWLQAANNTLVAQNLHNNETFKSALSKALSDTLQGTTTPTKVLTRKVKEVFGEEIVPEMTLAEYAVITDAILRYRFGMGDYDLDSFLADMHSNDSQKITKFERELKQCFYRRFETAEIAQSKEKNQNAKLTKNQKKSIKDSAKIAAKELAARMRFVMDAYAPTQDFSQEKIEKYLLKNLGFTLVDENALLDGSAPKNSDFFVKNNSGGYSVVTLDNFFAPIDDLGEPKPLFSQRDAIEAAAQLLGMGLHHFNAIGDYLGYNTQPHVNAEKKQTINTQQTADPVQAEQNAAIMNALVQYKDKEIAKKSESWDPLSFLGADAASALASTSTESADATDLMSRLYDEWHKDDQGEEAGEAKVRTKRRTLSEPNFSPEKLLALDLETFNAGLDAMDLAAARGLLSTTLSNFQSAHPNDPYYARFMTIFTELKRAAESKPAIKVALLNALDAIQTAVLERNLEARDAFRFMIFKNEQSLKQNGEFYFHKDAEDFIPKSLVKPPESFQRITSDYIDTSNQHLRLLANILHKHSLGENLDYKAMGLLFAHIDVNNNIHRAAFLQDNLLKFHAKWAKLQANPEAKQKQKMLLKELTKNKLSGKLATFEHYNQGSIYFRSASAATNDAGHCHYLAFSVLLAAETRGVDGLINIAKILQTLQKAELNDPFEGYRITIGLRTANILLNNAPVYINGQQTSLSKLFKRISNYKALVDTIYKSNYGLMLYLESDRSWGVYGHAISIGRILVGGEYLPIHFDANSGATICYTKEQLEYSLVRSFDAMGHDPNDVGYNKMRFKVLEMNSENILAVKSVQVNGIKFESLYGQQIYNLAKPHYTAANDGWNSVFSDLTTNDPTGSGLLQNKAVYNAGTKLRVGELLVLAEKAIKNFVAKPVELYSVDPVDFSSALKTSTVIQNPLKYFDFDIASTYGGDSRNSGLKSLAQKLKEPANQTPRGDFIKLIEVADIVGGLRASGGNKKLFLEEMLTMYVRRVIDTDPDARAAFTYFLRRTQEEMTQNSRVYSDVDLARFYLGEIRHTYHDPEFGLSARINLLTAKMLIAQAEGIVLPPSQLGLAFGEISVYRQVLDQVIRAPFYQAALQKHEQSLLSPTNLKIAQNVESALWSEQTFQARIDQYPNLKALLSKPDSQLTDVEIALKASIRKLNTISFSPLDMGVTKLLSDGSPLLNKQPRVSRFLALSAAMTLSTDDAIAGTVSNQDRFKAVLEGFDTLRNYAADDNVRSERLIHGLNKIEHTLNTQVQNKLQRLSEIIHIGTFGLRLETATNPFVVTMMNRADAGANTHTVSVSPIYIKDPSDQAVLIKSYLVTDSSLGAFPCADVDTAIEMVKLSANRYLGNSPDNSNFASIRLLAIEVDNPVREVLRFSTRTATEPSGKTHVHYEGPYARLAQSAVGESFNQRISYESLFQNNKPDWRFFSSLNEVTQHEGWQKIIPESFAAKRVLGIAADVDLVEAARQLGDFSGRSQADAYSNNLLRLSQKRNIGCTKGSCSADLKRYLKPEQQRVPDNALKKQLKATLSEGAIAQQRGSQVDIQPFARVRDIGNPVTPRDPSSRAVSAIAHRNTYGAIDGMHREQPKNPTHAEIVQGIENTATKTASADFEVVINKHTNPFTDSFSVNKYAAKNTLGAHQKTLPDGTEFNSDHSAMRTRINAAADALEAAAIIDPDTKTSSAAVSENSGNIQRKTISTQTGRATISSTYDAVGDREVRVDLGNGQKIQLSAGVGSTRDQAANLGRELFQALKSKNTVEADHNPVNKVNSEPKKIAQAPVNLAEAEEIHRILNVVGNSEDVILARQMAQGVEKLQMEIHAMNMLRAEFVEILEETLKARNLNPSDWEALPLTKSTIDTDEMTFVYRGAGEVEEKIIRISIPEEMKARFEATKTRIVNIANENTRLVPKRLLNMGILNDPNLRMIGKSMSVVVKIMNLFNMYHLFMQSDLSNLSPMYKAAFILGAADTAGDFVANLAGGINKLYKLVHAGVASTLLQSISRELVGISLRIGVAAGIGSIAAHAHAYAKAETDFEKDIALTNLSFASVSLTLTTFAMMVPPAFPIVVAIGLMLALVQSVVLEIKMEAERHRHGQKTLNERFERTEKLLELIKDIANGDMKDVELTEDNGVTTIIMKTQVNSKMIKLTENSITMLHGLYSFKVSMVNNKLFKYETLYKKELGAKLFEICNPKSEDQDCSLSLKDPVMEELIRKSGGHFIDDQFKFRKMTRINPYGYDILKSKKYMTYEYKNTAVLPCLYFGDNPTDLQNKIVRFLVEKKEYQSQNKIVSFRINQSFPKVNLRSAMTYIEDFYQHRKWTSKKNVVAITKNVCKPNYERYKPIMVKAHQQAQDLNPYDLITPEDAAVGEGIEFNWKSKYPVVLAPAALNKYGNYSTQRTQLIGSNYFLLDHHTRDALSKKRQYSGLSAYTRIYNRDAEHARKLGFSGPEETQVSTVLDEVILEQDPVQQYELDLQDVEMLQLVLEPDKFATEIITKTNFYFNFENKETKEKSTLRIHPDTYKKIKQLPSNYIHLAAHQSVDVVVGIGSFTDIEERGYGLHSDQHKGMYHVRFMPTYMAEHQQQIVQNIDMQIADIEGEIAYMEYQKPSQWEQELTVLTSKIEEMSEGNLIGKYARDTARQLESLQNRQSYLQTEITKNWYAVDDKKLQLETLNIMKEGFLNRPTEDAKHLKTQIVVVPVNERGRDSLTNQIIEITFNPSNKSPDKLKPIERLAQGFISFRQSRRDIILSHNEAFEVNDKELRFNCVFNIKRFPNRQFIFAFSHIQNASIEEINLMQPAGNMKTFFSQLKANNPQLQDFPTNIVFSGITLTDKDANLVGVLPQNTSVPIHDPNDFTGYVSLFGIDTNSPQMVSFLYRKDTPEPELEFIRRLQFIGGEKITNRAKTPPELHALYDSLPDEKRMIYFLYDLQTNTIVRQYMNSVLRAQDREVCKASELPTRVFGKTGAFATDSFYTCLETGRVDLMAEVAKCKADPAICSDFFDALNQEQHNRQVNSLILTNPGYIKSGEEKEIFMGFFGGDIPFLIMTPAVRNFAIVAKNIEERCAILSEKVEDSDDTIKQRLALINSRRPKGTVPFAELMLSRIDLIMGDELRQLGSALLTEDIKAQNTLADFVKSATPLPHDMHVISMIEANDKLILGTTEGVIVSVNLDLSERHLIGVDEHYFSDYGIDVANETALTQEYKRLVAHFGAPESAYVKFASGLKNATEPNFIVFLDTLNQTPLYVPRNGTISEEAMFLGSLELNHQISEITVVDPKSQIITTVENPLSSAECQLNNQVRYSYVSQTEGHGLVLALKADETDEEIKLPYLPVKNIYFQPQKQNSKGKNSRIVISEATAEQLMLITLLPENSTLHSNRKVQPIDLESDDPSSAAAFIQLSVRQEISVEADDQATAVPSAQKKVLKTLFITVPKAALASDGEGSSLYLKQKGLIGIAETHTLIRLYDAFEEDGGLKSCFADAIAINGVALSSEQLNKMVTEAQILPDPDSDDSFRRVKY